MATILICDDERNLREILCFSLEGAGHRVVEAADGGAALRLLEQEQIDLVITDLKLPDISGIEVLRRSKKLVPGRPVLLITAYASTETAVTAMREGAFDYLEKPFRVEDLHLVVTRALEQNQLQQENIRLRKALKKNRNEERPVIGNSRAMRRLMEQVSRVARTDATVLISGESGTGKELIARAIHDQSPRREAPFVAINCAAIPENLIESELFGHSKGAFSGAVSSRKGLFVEAEGGTLFLDEIGEMPLEAQVKLLRVLQERSVRPVGGSNEKREDIPLLVARFIETSAERYGLSVHGIVPEALDALQAYDFPGNIRELENLIEGAVAMAVGEQLELANFPERLRHPGASTSMTEDTATLPEEGLDLEQHMAEMESALIRQALERTGGNKTQAAELLGLSFRSFRYRVKKLKL